MPTISVNLTTQEYQIKIETGLATAIGHEVQQVWSARKIALVTDTNVGPLYQTQITEQLTQAGFQVTVLTIPAGESAKSLEQAMILYQALVTANFNRSDGLIALGGGVVGDLTGFVASTYMRGLPFIQIPTSLLAQVDSSVGGKTALDLPAGKNLVGTFYQPDLVLIDPQMLETLPQRQLVTGYAEVVKVAALVGNDFWNLVQQIASPSAILDKAPELITRSIAYKAQIVMADVQESGQRRLLNFGHTIGHAVESLANGELTHGEAVSIGLVAMSRLFEQPTQIAAQLQIVLERVGLPVTHPLLQSPALFEKIAHDKKNQGVLINIVYLKAIGQPTILQLPLTQFSAQLKMKQRSF
ncbi:3-dehydroquinate synthase [Latilactobacillus sakei]